MASLVSAALGVATATASAQQARPLVRPAEFVLDQWTTADGLPQNSVNAIAQTPDGLLWLGTFGGLTRFDGTSFRLVERTDSAGRHIDRVLALAVGPDSALWIGTEEGLFRLKSGSYRAYTVAHGLPDNLVRALGVDRSGALWIGTTRGGLARLADADGAFESFESVDGRALGPVSSIVADRAGDLWINTGDTFVTVDSGRLSTARPRTLPVQGRLRFALEESGGARWFAAGSRGVRLAGDTVQYYAAREGVGGVNVAVQDPAGGIWIGALNDGLVFLDPRAPARPTQKFQLPNGAANYRVLSALVDRESNVWFGTNANGLLRVTRQLFTTYTTSSGLSHDVMTAVFEDAGGTLWAATNCGGLNAIDPRRASVRTFKPRMPGSPLGDPCVFALTESPVGTLWVGTYGGGLSRIRDGREERLRGRTGLKDSVVTALFTDRGGTVWVGTNSAGLARLEGTRVAATYTVATGLAHNSVRTIHQSRDGALWVGTLGGASRLVDGAVTSYTAAQGLGSEHVRAIHEDREGILWVGTYGGGVNRFADGRFTAVTREHGLADDVVSSILEDDGGDFWMSGNRGIQRVARSDLIAHTEGRLPMVHAELYGGSDGLLNAETNGGFQPAAWRDATGRFWYPTVRGLGSVDPARLRRSGLTPPTAIEEVVVNGVSRPPAEGIVVGPPNPNLEFRYAGLSLTAPEHLTYRFRLEGFDDDWVIAGARRVAYYPRLSPGQYRFLVSAASRDGTWNPVPAAVTLRVLAPVWQRGWFRLLVLMTIGTAAWVVLRRRRFEADLRRRASAEFSRQLIENEEHERLRIARELHDGLGQELLVVKNRALLLLQADDLGAGARRQVEALSDTVSASLTSLRGIAHNITPHQLEYLGLTSALRTLVETVAATSGRTWDWQIEEVDGLLSLEHEINLYRIVQEAIANVARHSEAAAATVRIRRATGMIELTISDDGKGFRVLRETDGKPVGGFGITGMVERVRILGGRMELDSAPGRGTRLRVEIPVA